MGAIKMPSQSAIAKAYEDAIPRAGPRYKEKVGEVTNFKELAVAGQENYVTQMTNPDVLARRRTELEKMPPDEWKKGAQEKGAARIGTGMTAAKEKRTRNYEVIRSGLDGFVIPDRVIDWEANVDNRSKAVVRKMKEIAGKL